MKKDIDINKIIEFYKKGYSARKISEILNVNISTILNRLKDNNIKIVKYRKYQINENLFNKIETSEKAYWLGFLISDGYNSGKYIRIDIQDKGHLEKLRDIIFINKDMPIREKINKTNGKTIYYLTIQSKKIVNDLEKHGVLRKKSLITFYPNIQSNLDRHFIRGVFDGDGSLSKTKQTKSYFKYLLSILGTEELLLNIKKRIEVNGINVGYGNCRNIKRIFICGNQQISRFLIWIYEDSTISLERKFLKYEELINYNQKLK